MPPTVVTLVVSSSTFLHGTWAQWGKSSYPNPSGGMSWRLFLWKQHLGLNLLLSVLLFFCIRQTVSGHLCSADRRQAERFISEEGKAASARPAGHARVFSSSCFCSLRRYSSFPNVLLVL